MKSILFFVILFVQANELHANWLCREAASARNGDTINACGVGEAQTESEARTKARELAFEELDSICSKTPDCSNFEYVIQPMRTDCEKNIKGYKCYRGIEATITTRRRDPTQSRNSENKIVTIKSFTVQEDLLANKVERAVVPFKTKPAGAIVQVDGIQICETPCSRELQLGKHEILIEKANYESYSTTLNVSKNLPTVIIELSSLFGSLDVSEIPLDADIKIDDIKIDEDVIKLKPGKHLVTLESKYYQPYFKEIEIKRGVTSKLHNVLEPLFGFIDISAKDKSGNALRANIFIDGIKLNEITPAKIKVASGKRKIELTTSNKFYASASRIIESDTVYNLNFILTGGDSKNSNAEEVITTTPQKYKAPLERLFEKPSQCNNDEECNSDSVCATIRGEYPGSCVKKGLGI